MSITRASAIHLGGPGIRAHLPFGQRYSRPALQYNLHVAPGVGTFLIGPGDSAYLSIFKKFFFGCLQYSFYIPRYSPDWSTLRTKLSSSCIFLRTSRSYKIGPIHAKVLGRSPSLQGHLLKVQTTMIQDTVIEPFFRFRKRPSEQDYASFMDPWPLWTNG